MESDWPSGFPCINWLSGQDEEAVTDVVRKGAFFRYYGPQSPTQVNQLEEYARTFYGVRHALAVNRGTGAVANVQLRKLPQVVAHTRASNQRIKDRLATEQEGEMTRAIEHTIVDTVAN